METPQQERQKKQEDLKHICRAAREWVDGKFEVPPHLRDVTIEMLAWLKHQTDHIEVNAKESGSPFGHGDDAFEVLLNYLVKWAQWRLDNLVPPWFKD